MGIIFVKGKYGLQATVWPLWAVADLEIAGGGMLGPNNRPPDGRRREAPEVVRGGGFGRGSPSTPSRKGVRGYHPR